MKRKEFIKHLLRSGCVFIREGANHSVFYNNDLKRTSTVPRHSEIHNLLAKKICKDLGISEFKK